MRLYKDFGPIVQARKELEEMSEMRRHTNQLLQNILPLHVAKYFLEQDRQFHELYAQGKPNWYFVTKIVLTYCEKKFVQTLKGQNNFW